MHNECTLRVSDAIWMRRVVARFRWIQKMHNGCTTVRVSEARRMRQVVTRFR